MFGAMEDFIYETITESMFAHIAAQLLVSSEWVHNCLIVDARIHIAVLAIRLFSTNSDPSHQGKARK